MFKHDHLLSTPSPETVLWRYMDFAKFVALLEKRSLFFARADKLGDPFEGYLPRRLLEELKNTYSGNADPKDNIFWNMTQVFKTVATFTLVCCWHESPYESAAMWKLYSRENDGIAIKTTFESLSKSLICDEDVFISRVNYIDYDTINPVGIFDQKDRMFLERKGHDLSIRSQLLHKRNSFEHEREVRAIHPIAMKGLYSGGMTKEIAQPPYDFGHYLQTDLPLLIHNIVVAPFAPDWFVELVGSVATHYHCDGLVTQSSLGGDPIWH